MFWRYLLFAVGFVCLVLLVMVLPVRIIKFVVMVCVVYFGLRWLFVKVKGETG